MKRRSVLLGAGALASGGLARLATYRKSGTIDVKIWLTEAAAAFPTSRQRAAGYIRQSLERAGTSVDISFGETTIRPGGRSARAIERQSWPKQVVRGTIGTAGIEPVEDVNLLVTNGDVYRPTAGYAYPTIAAVPGAKYLAEMGRAMDGPTVYQYSVPAAVTQLLLHEVGHALGLGHDHGAVSIEAGKVTASPMIGGYAWDSERVPSKDHSSRGPGCGRQIPDDIEGVRHLSMVYSACAAEVLLPSR